MRITPSLLPEGRQYAGSIPLTPLFWSIIFNLIRVYRNRRDARAAGVEA